MREVPLYIEREREQERREQERGRYMEKCSSTTYMPASPHESANLLGSAGFGV
jgi:hypothetical protein